MPAAMPPRPPSLRREMLLLGASAVLLGAAALLPAVDVPPAVRAASWALHGAAWLLAGGNVVAAAARGVLRGRVLDETFLMTVATAGAFAIGQPREAVAVMLFYKVGEILQERSVRRSRASIARLLDLRPRTARVRAESGVRELPPDEVPRGAVVIVRAGERVPVDGLVIDGSAFLDTSALTGEPVPRRAAPGDEVLAGSISTDGGLELRATRPGAESSAARIAELVARASQSKARTEQFIRRFARVYTPIVVAAAALVAFLPPLLFAGAGLGDWVHRALTMLVIACPCALVVSIPLGYVGGVGGASRRGVLVKGAMHLDALARLRTVVFDKTGTLTEGRFALRRVVPRNGVEARELLRLAALAESHSNHPIAASIRAAYEGPPPDGRVRDVREVGGRGVQAVVDGRAVLAGNDRLLHEHAVEHDTCTVDGTAVHVAVDGTWAGYLVIGDAVRPDAPEALRRLRAMGVRRTVLLTGDDREVAARLARDLGIGESHGDLLPEGKVSHMERILREEEGRGITAFVGDGINDAPVLGRADVGVAMGAHGAEAAVETADVVLMSPGPAGLVQAVRQARRTRAIVVQNIVLALGVKGAFLVLGAFGVATMWEAVIADMGVALAAILNATRALRGAGGHKEGPRVPERGAPTKEVP